MKKIKHLILLGILAFTSFALPMTANASTYAKTKYPIVMVHGAFGFDSILGVVDYWYFITSNMRTRGAEVYVVNMSSAALHEERGEQLLADIEEILAISGASKVNIIAHSQGATSSRYVAAMRPEWIASISCSHCMNEGTHFATGFGNLLENIGIGGQIVDDGVSMLLDLLELITSAGSDGEFNSDLRVDQSMMDLVKAASLDDYNRFNALYPAAMPTRDCSIINGGRNGVTGGGAAKVNGIAYYSWGGKSPITNRVDPFDSIVIPLTKTFMGGDLIWDGLVPQCGMALGKLLRADYKSNHYDAINHALALTAFGMNIPSIYYTHANRLKYAGL